MGTCYNWLKSKKDNEIIWRVLWSKSDFKETLNNCLCWINDVFLIVFYAGEQKLPKHFCAA